MAARYLALENFLEEAFKGKWFTPVSIMEKIQYVERLAEAKQDFWEEVYSVYPQLLGKSIVCRGDWLIVRED